MNLWILVIEFINLVENKVMRYLFVFLLVGLMSCGSDTKTNNNTSKGTNSLKQPKCEEIDGYEIDYNDEGDYRNVWPKNHTGVIKICENGKVRIFSTLKNGQSNGLERWWDEDGNIEYETLTIKAQVDDGYESIYDGSSRTWHKNGKLATYEIYEKGQLISEECWNEKGEKIQCPKPEFIEYHEY